VQAVRLRYAPHALGMDIEELEAILAVAKFVLSVHVSTASGTDERTLSPQMIQIDPVTAYPTLVHLDVTITIIDHIPETTFVA
jgi:hypothetical protein